MIGSRPRIVRRRDGSNISLIIRRLRCRECGTIHHELPDMIIPYKRCSSKCVAGILTSPNHAPCETSSVARLRIWFILLKRTVSESLRRSSEIRRFRELTAMSMSDPPESMNALLKFLVKKATNAGRWIFERAPRGFHADSCQGQSSI